MAGIEYGAGGAGFSDTIARMRAESAAIADLAAKEAQRSAAEERDTAATRENATARRATASAVDALVDTIGRSIEVLDAETASIEANTGAWAANAAARGRAIGAATGGVALPETAATGTAGAVDLSSVVSQRAAAARASAARSAEGAAGAAGASKAADSDLAAVAERNSEALATQAERQAAVNDLSNRSAAAYSASSQALQRHGALTSEFFEGLTRGEVTLKEFESQMVITLGKFSGWAIAGGLVYGAFEAVKNVASGISETQSGVDQLKRSLGEKLNVPEAEAGFRRVSQEVNVPISTVARAQFFAARAFPNQKESLDVAGTAVRAEKLDEVPIQEAIKSFGALNATFGLTAEGIKTIFNELDAGQLKFNARIQQTLPQVGRAAASFANAGGTPTQLVQQIIELNRATGGGGGQGGGNPATFLIREPGNLAKPATEDTLRAFGFDPKRAQEHIGDFNEEVQKRSAEGKLSHKDLEELATAVGGGTANGLRYGLPLFAAGASGLAGRVQREVNPQAASGAAAEDLSHKLAQLDEQGKKAGITLQAIGSELSSIGVGPALVDAAHGLNLVLAGAEVLVSPLSAVGDLLGAIPAPLRLIAEATLAFKAAQLLTRSGPGLAASGLANQAGLTFLGGGARDLTAVQATQRSYVKFLQDEQEKLSNAALAASSRARLSGAQVTSFVRPGEEVAALGDEDRAAYEARLAALLKNEVNTAEAQEVAAKAQLDQKAILVAAEEQLAVLTNKRVSVSERLLAASESGLYAAQLGSPNTLPILSPNASAAETEAARAQGAFPVPVATRAAGGEGVAGAATGASAEAVAAESATAATAISGIRARVATAATTVATELPAALTALRESLVGFITGLGPLGITIGGFVALDELVKITGGSREFEDGASALAALEGEVTSERDAIEKIQKTRAATHQGFFEKVIGGVTGAGSSIKLGGVGGYLHDVLARAEHPIADVEELFGKEGEHPEDFVSAQIIAREKKAKALEAQRKKGDFKGLGQITNVPAEVLKQYGDELEQELAGLEAGQSSKTSEKAAAGISKRVKLLFDRLNLFGTGGSGVQELQKLETLYGSLANKATSSGDENLLDEFAKTGDEVNKGIEELVARELKHGLRLAHSATEREQVLQSARSKLSESAKNQFPIAKAEEGLDEVKSQLNTVNTQLSAKPNDESLKKRQEALKLEAQKREKGLEQFRAAEKTIAREREEALEAEGKEVFQADTSEFKASSTLAQARTSNKDSQSKIQLKQIAKELEAAEATLIGPERTKTIEELEASKAKAEQQLVAGRLSLLKSQGQKREAEVPNQQPVQLAQVQLKQAEEQSDYIQAHKKDFSLEEVIDAETAVIKAKKAVNEAISQNAQQISQLNTQIAQAQSTGDAVAQANEAIAGANEQIKLAVGSQQRLQGQLALINANNQLQQALQQKVKDEAELAKSLTTNPIKAGQIDVNTAKQLLGLAKGPDERLKAEAELNNAKKSLAQETVNIRESEISFHQEMGEISIQQAIQQYDELLKIHDLSKQTREGILSKVRQLELGSQNNQVFDLAPGSIKLPTVYDVHRAIGKALRITGGSGSGQLIGPTGGVSAEVTQTNNINVYVTKAGDAKHVADELDRVTHAGLKSSMRKVGLR